MIGLEELRSGVLEIKMSVFLPEPGLFIMHIPRTGGTSIRWAIVKDLRENVDLTVPRDRYRRSLGERHHITLQECPLWFLQRVNYVACFVRHPFEHYASLWRLLRARMDKGNHRRLWKSRVAGKRGDLYKSWSCFSMVTDLWSPDFTEWVERILDREPAFTTRLYEQFVGLEHKETCDFIGRAETMMPDLERLLKHVGAGRLAGKVNLNRRKRQHTVRDKYYEDTRWTEDLKRRVAESEKSTIRRFYGPETKDKRFYTRVSLLEE